MNRIITIDEMIALCDEIRSLSKAGVPLEKGLISAAKDLPKRLGNAANTIGSQGAQGIAVEDVIEEDLGLPAIFKSVIRAGKRSGNLALALEGLYDSGKRAIEIRRKIIIAMFYPILVLALIAYASAFMFGQVPDAIAQSVREQGLPTSQNLLWFLAAVNFVNRWVWVPLVVMLVGFIFWSILTRSAMLARSNWFASVTGWVPWIGRLLRLGRLAIFTDLLAMFVRQRVPLPEALTLSAEVTGDAGLGKDAQTMADRIQAGQPLMMEDGQLTSIPTLLQWLLDLDRQDGDLADSLQLEAKAYQSSAEDLADWCNIQLPLFFTVGIAGTATAIYALCVMLPWVTFLQQFALPI